MYPYTSLTVITPIVFFVLLVLFPVIGVFAGWKRAAYWGGGNLLIYIIGLIIWKCAGGALSQGYVKMLAAILGDKIYELDYHILLNSIVTPLFYVTVFLIGNVILVICYYIFAKRLIGIGKYDKFKHPENFKKEDKNFVRSSASVPTKKQVHVANTKWFNMVVGGVGMTVLMLPITLSTTHLVTMATTSSDTRKTNAFTSGMYDGLQNLSKHMSWFSYYNGDVNGRDFDGIFSLIEIYDTTIKYKDVLGQEQTANIVKALTETLGQGFDNLINKTIDETISTKTKETIQQLIDALNNLVESWNSIHSQCEDDIKVVFNSPGIITLLKSIILESKEKIVVTDAEIQSRFAEIGSIFNKIEEAYINGQLVLEDGTIIELKQVQDLIEIPQDAFDTLTNVMYELYDTTQLTEQNIEVLKQKTHEQLEMFFKTK